jgi:uncharacterized short protein YbdD (DUF466 family)
MMNHQDTKNTKYALIEGLQRVMGAGSYERYREYLKKNGRERELPSREEFYLDSLKRRYAAVSRCC